MLESGRQINNHLSFRTRQHNRSSKLFDKQLSVNFAQCGAYMRRPYEMIVTGPLLDI